MRGQSHGDLANVGSMVIPGALVVLTALAAGKALPVSRWARLGRAAVVGAALPEMARRSGRVVDRGLLTALGRAVEGKAAMPDPDDTRFATGFDLERLPWFELRDGRLVLADRSIGPVFDMHAHLALAYVRANRIDLQREWARTEHYLPMERSLDLDVYANRNLSQDDLGRMRRDLTLGSLGAAGMRRTHTLANLRREMRELGVDGACLLPIDFPALSGNSVTWLRAAAGHGEIVGFGSVHPYACGLARRLDRLVGLGARGVKIHPAAQTFPPSARRAIELYRLCGERGLPVLWHCGPVDIETWLGRRLSQVRLYARAIESCPDTTFVLGHSGALQMGEALELALGHRNVWLDLSSQSLSNIRTILDRADPERILFGSDWPFYHQAVPLAKVLIASDGRPELRARVLWGNAARLLGLDAAGPRPA